MAIFWSIIVFLFGLFIGSFLNSVIYRLFAKESFLKGRSFCPNCKHKLAWCDLIPVLSFFVSRGRCRYCQQKISWQYPLVEISTGLLFLSIYNLQSTIYNWVNLLYLFFVASCLIIIFVYDLKHYLIPDKVLFPAIVAVFVYNTILNSQFSIFNSLLSAIIASAFFLIIFLISQGKWLGFGDVKLVFLMGLFLGFPNILAALFLAFFIGAIIGLGLIILREKNLKSEIPFGPFLIIGTFLALFLGQNLVNWYLNLLF